MRLSPNRAALGLAASLGLLAAPAFAQSWAEVASGGTNGAVDAGELLPTANITDGSGALSTITGSLSAGLTPASTSFFDADLFCIRIANPAAFAASITYSGSGDSNLSLFNSSGQAVAFNDDAPGAGFGQPSALTSLHTASLPAGHYFLAVSRNITLASTGAVRFTRPLDASGNLIFAGQPYGAPNTDPLAFNRGLELAPSTPGTQLAGWETFNGFAFPFNLSYTISLSGCEYCVPAPSGLAALLAGAGLIARRRR